MRFVKKSNNLCTCLSHELVVTFSLLSTNSIFMFPYFPLIEDTLALLDLISLLDSFGYQGPTILLS